MFPSRAGMVDDKVLQNSYADFPDNALPVADFLDNALPVEVLPVEVQSAPHRRVNPPGSDGAI